jgi:hypothetical protein
MAGDRSPKFFDRGPQLAAVTPVDLIALRVLADAFFC